MIGNLFSEAHKREGDQNAEAGAESRGTKVGREWRKAEVGGESDAKAGGMIEKVGDKGPKQSSAFLVAHALARFVGPHPSKQLIKADHCKDFSHLSPHDLDPVSIPSFFVSGTSLAT